MSYTAGRSGTVMNGPPAMNRCGDHGHRNNRGEPCGAPCIKGTVTCRRHAGKPIAQAKAQGAIRLEIAQWGLDGHTDLRDPGETLLRLVTQSAARVELYSRLLEEAYTAAEDLRQAHEVDGLDLTGPDGEEPPQILLAARKNMRRVFTTGGVAALIGVKLTATNSGSVFPTEEAIRGLVKLEADERDRCATFAAKAVAAGLAERQVRLAERQGALMYAVFGRVHTALLDQLGLSEGQRMLAGQLLPGLLAAEIGALTGHVIEGSVA